jgi:hypothetical protein
MRQKDHPIISAGVLASTIMTWWLSLVPLQAMGDTTAPENNSFKPVTRAETIEEKWGIQIQGIRLSAAGYMLDFRYRVINVEKALPLFNRKIKPYLIDQATGTKTAVPNPPKVGPLRTSNQPIANRIYFMFFANPGRFIKSGNKVTVVVGDFRAENLTVQ